MPRDGSGVHQLDPGYLAVAGQTIQPSQHNPPLEDLSAAITDSIARTGVTAVTADIPFGGFKLTGVGDATLDTDALNRQSADARYLSPAGGDARYNPRTITKSANYTLVAADIGALIVGTGTWTLTLPAAATAANGFSFRLQNNGTGLITIDPDASETINGATTFVVHPRQTVLVACNGTAWAIIDYAGGWRVIFDQTKAAASPDFTVDMLSAAGFRFYRAKLLVVPNSSLADFAVIARLSDDGGSTYKAGASDYNVWGFYIGAGTLSPLASSNQTYLSLTGTIDTGVPSVGCYVDFDIKQGSASQRFVIQSRNQLFNGSDFYTFNQSGQTNGSYIATHMQLFSGSAGNVFDAGSRLVIEAI